VTLGSVARCERRERTPFLAVGLERTHGLGAPLILISVNINCQLEIDK
jgi:hypothetical protein